jgi:hypothetical protein
MERMGEKEDGDWVLGRQKKRRGRNNIVTDHRFV